MNITTEITKAGHDEGCWEWWAEMAVEAGHVDNDATLLEIFLSEAGNGWEEGRGCHCWEKTWGAPGIEE